MKEHIWYVLHRPDLLLVDPCGAKKVLEDAVWASIKHLHPADPDAYEWKHPKATAMVTAYGHITDQKPRVVKCACGQAPCLLTTISDEGQEVPPQCIPSDWSTNYVQVDEFEPTKQRRMTALGVYLECTGKADKELPVPEGEESPLEDEVRASADLMFTEYLKGRCCFNCNLPSKYMKKCSRCLRARYCSPECFKDGWAVHKKACEVATGLAGGAAGAAEAQAQEAAPAEAGSS